MIGLAIVTAFSVTVTWMVFATLRRDIAGPTNTYSAIFSDISGLTPGDDVRVAGVRVGRVDKVELAGTDAKVTFRVQDDQTLYTDTVASVTYQNIIGQRYLGLSQGASGNQDPLPDHGQIPKERTSPSLDIAYVLNGFEPLFTQLDSQQVDNLTNAIIEAFQGESRSILALTTQASALAETMAGPDQVLGDLIGNLNQVMATLAAQNANLQTVITQSREVMAQLASRRHTLLSSVGSINATTDRLAAIVDTITPQVRQLLDRRPGILDYGLHDGRARLAYMGANVPFLIKGLSRVTQDGSYINAYACDLDFRLWSGLFYWVRAFVAAATPGNGHEVWHTAKCR